MTGAWWGENCSAGDGTDRRVGFRRPFEPPRLMCGRIECDMSCGRWWVILYFTLTLLNPLSLSSIQLILSLCFWFSRCILFYSPDRSSPLHVASSSLPRCSIAVSDIAVVVIQSSSGWVRIGDGGVRMRRASAT